MEMISPKIVNGDLIIENGDVVLVSDDDELAQSTAINLKTRLGEFFLEEDSGLNRENILGKNFNHELVRDDIIECVMQDDRIASVENIEIVDDRAKRKRTISLTLVKDNGDTVQVEGVEL
jgi:hypothetical protein